MSQQSLSGLAILSNENIRAKMLDKEDIVEDFVKKNTRRQNRFKLELEINESILEFENVSDHSAAGLEKNTLELIEEKYKLTFEGGL